MKVCVPAMLKEQGGSKVYPHIGSAPVYFLYDTESQKTELIKNSLNSFGGHASTDGLLSDKKIKAIIALKISQEVLEAFEQKGIKVYQCIPDSADANIKAFVENQLKLFEV